MAETKEACAAEWKAIVDEALFVRPDGMVRMWTRDLERGSAWLTADMTPDEADELARELQSSASAARQVRVAPAQESSR